MILFLDIAMKQERKENDLLSESLLIRVGQEDKEAFEQLYQLSCHAVFGFAFSILKNRQDAEDVMQDTFLKIRTAAHLYEPRQKPMAWILTITRNFCLMKVRALKKASFLNYEDLDNDPRFAVVTDAEDRLLIKAAFVVLSEQERQIIVLHAISGLKHREIGELLGIPLATVLSKYRRALAKMKKELLGKEQENE